MKTFVTSKERVLELASYSPDYKECLKQLFPSAFAPAFDPDKIYAFKMRDRVYKLHALDDENTKYAFVSMNDSYCWVDASFHKKAMANHISDPKVKSFDTLKGFLQWAIEVTK